MDAEKWQLLSAFSNSGILWQEQNVENRIYMRQWSADVAQANSMGS
jgi:hypothetical protein